MLIQRLAATMEDLSGDGGVLKKQLQVGIGTYIIRYSVIDRYCIAALLSVGHTLTCT